MPKGERRKLNLPGLDGWRAVFISENIDSSKIWAALNTLELYGVTISDAGSGDGKYIEIKFKNQTYAIYDFRGWLSISTSYKGDPFAVPLYQFRNSESLAMQSPANAYIEVDSCATRRNLQTGNIAGSITNEAILYSATQKLSGMVATGASIAASSATEQLGKFLQWDAEHNKSAYAALGTCGILLAAGVAYLTFRNNPKKPQANIRITNNITPDLAKLLHTQKPLQSISASIVSFEHAFTNQDQGRSKTYTKDTPDFNSKLKALLAKEANGENIVESKHGGSMIVTLDNGSRMGWEQQSHKFVTYAPHDVESGMPPRKPRA